MKLSIGLKIGALASALVVASASVIAWNIMSLSQAHIVQHEIVDLSDETNLIATETREQLQLLRNSVGALAAQITAQPPEKLRSLIESWLSDHPYCWEVEVRARDDAPRLPTVVRQPELESITEGTTKSSFLESILAMAPGKNPQSELQISGIAQITYRVPEELTFPPGVVPHRTGKRAVVYCGAELAGGGVLLVTSSLSAINRLSDSTRHILFLVDNKGEYVWTSEGASHSTKVPEDSSPIRAGVEELNRIHSRPAMTEDHRHLQRRGYTEQSRSTLGGDGFVFASSQPVESSLISRDGPPLAWLNVLAELKRDFPSLRIGLPSLSTLTFRVRAPSEEELLKGKKELAERLRTQADWNGKISWKPTVQCDTFMLHFTRIRIDQERWLDLISGASYEEIESDVASEQRGIVQLTVILTAIAVVLAILFSLAITLPLKRIIAATERFGRGEFNDPDLPVNDHGEIGVLARAFEWMVDQVRQRSAALIEREDRMRSIVTTAADGILTIDESGQIESLNRAGERIFGYGEDEARRKKFDGSFRAINPGDHTFRELSSRPLTTLETVGIRKEGQQFPMELSVSKVGERSLFTCIVRDITERKRTEAEIRQLNAYLRELNDALEQRVFERTSELEQANTNLALARDEALEASRAKSAFLAQMSHELRTPLNAIIGYGELLIEEHEGTDHGSNLIPDLTKVVDAGRHLLALINDILDLSKIEAGRMELYLETFEIGPLLESVMETILPLAEKNHNRLSLQGLPIQQSTPFSLPERLGEMRADKTRVRQILINLLSNATKFTKEGDVRLEVVRKELEGLIEFRVVDTGIGIPKDKLGKLFQSFVQADASTTRKYGGTGLGLAISRRFTEMLQGTIRVESEPGVGSTFFLTLPIQPSRTEIETPGLEDSRAGCILVIDDDPTIRDLMQRILTKEGYHVVTAESGGKGLDLARKLHPILITLDVMMPQVDGWMVLSELKADPLTHDIPVLMLTIVDDRNLGFALGATDYLTKPIDKDRLLQLLERYRGSNGEQVMIVDDDHQSRILLDRMIRSAGWRTVLAENGREALDQIHRNPPTLILLDLMMPEMDGFQFLEEVRYLDSMKGIPVLVITARELEPSEKQWLEGRVQRVIQKGSQRKEDLVREIRQLLSRPFASTQPT